MADSNFTIVDAAGATQTISTAADAGNSSYLVPKHHIVDSAGAAIFPASASTGDAITAAATLPSVVARQMAYNGATFDRVRNNITQVILASGSRTTTQTGSAILTYNARTVSVTLITTTVGSGSITLTIQGLHSDGSTYNTLLAGAAVVTDTTNVYTVGLGAAVTANVSANRGLPASIRILITANNANAAVYSCGLDLSV